MHQTIFTGSIARSATRRYLIYSKADFEVFRPAGATRCTDWGEIYVEEGTEFGVKEGTEVTPNFTAIGIGAPKLKFLLRLDQNVQYKRPAGAYPLRDFHKIYTICTAFQYALAFEISLDLLKGLWRYGGFKLTGSGYLQHFQRPLAAKLCVRPQKF